MHFDHLILIIKKKNTWHSVIATTSSVFVTTMEKSNYKAKSWRLCLGKISKEVFLSNDSKFIFGSSKHFFPCKQDSRQGN